MTQTGIDAQKVDTKSRLTLLTFTPVICCLDHCNLPYYSPQIKHAVINKGNCLSLSYMKYGLHCVIHSDRFALHSEVDVFNFLKLSHPLQGGNGIMKALIYCYPPRSLTLSHHLLNRRAQISVEG